MFKNASGLNSLLKDGGQHYAGVDEAVLQNIQAGTQLSTLTRTSFGPCGKNKLIVNHLDKHFVTSDTATMLQELDVMHPAGKMLVMATKAQEQECGDGTNAVAILAGELLAGAEDLLKQGVHIADIITGYELAAERVIEKIQDKNLVGYVLDDVSNVQKVQEGIQSVIAAKQYGYEDLMSRIVATACVDVLKGDVRDFDPDNVRVAKVSGCGNIYNTYTVNGMAITRDTMGVEKVKVNAKVAVFGCPIEMTGTETSGTVLLESGQQLLDFTKGEEKKIEEFVKSLADANVDVVISGGSVQDIALHFLNKYRILVLKCTSKFEMRRLCRSLGATAIVRLGKPLPDELGFAQSVCVEEISSTKMTIFRAGSDSKISTIVLRGATNNMLDEAARAIDDAVNVMRCCCCKAEREFVIGGGACEIDLALDLSKYGSECSGLEQYSVLKFAEALEAIPKLLAENAGLNSIDAVTELKAMHAAGATRTCIDIEACSATKLMTCDGVARKIFDHKGVKIWAIRLAVEAAITVLRVQHVIVAKQSGGPKTKGNPQVEDD